MIMAHRETKLTNAQSETGKQNKYLVTYLVDKSEDLEDRVREVTYNPLFVEVWRALSGFLIQSLIQFNPRRYQSLQKHYANLRCFAKQLNTV